MQCDVCGREIIGKPYRVIIEGAKMVTCEECSSLGSEYWEPKPSSNQLKTHQSGITKAAKPTTKMIPDYSMTRAHSGVLIEAYGRMEIIEGFGLIVRQARERMGLTPEDLGKRIGEKESVIKKIESEKIVPDLRLASKLEHALKIRILTETREDESKRAYSPSTRVDRTVTLGEIVQLKGVKRRKREDEGDNSLSKGSP